MAWAARTRLLREAALPVEAVGLLHAHAGADVRLLREEHAVEGPAQARAVLAPGGPVQREGCPGPLRGDRQHHRGLHRHLHDRDVAGRLQQCPEALADAGGALHSGLHSGVRLQIGSLRRGRPVALALRHRPLEPLRLDGRPALLRGHDHDGRGGPALAAHAAGLPGAALPTCPHLQARPLCIWHASHGRSPPQLDAGHLRARLPALHGRGALLERPLPRRAAELPDARRVDRRRLAGVCRGVRRRLQPRRVAELRPLLHRGLGAQQLPKHHSSHVVVHGHHDLRGLRRRLPEDHAGEVCRLRGHAGRHGAHSLARGHCRPEVSGHLRAARPRRGQAPRGHAPPRRKQGLVASASERRPAPAQAPAHQGPRPGKLRGRARRIPGGCLGAARAAHAEPPLRD
mmetsp:Transcript_4377/g.12804  ORF Transcript_4377/g.12804 Transcript_4377/m.12804 type:complete len:401 (-) Transcript_4377:219-1421(-)